MIVKTIPVCCKTIGADAVEASIAGRKNLQRPQIAISGSDGTIPNRFQIFVKTPKGKTTVIWTYDNDTVTDLRNNIAVQIGYPARKQHLLNGAERCRTTEPKITTSSQDLQSFSI